MSEHKDTESPSMSDAMLEIWRSVASLIFTAAHWLRTPELLGRLRGYLIIAFGLIIVTRVLNELVGAIPGLPSPFSYGLLLIAMVLAMYCYRQTLAYLRWHDSKSRHDRLRSLRVSGPESLSEDERIARERHWRTRRATIWGIGALSVLLVYALGVTLCVHKANIGDVREDVVVPFWLPEERAAYVTRFGVDNILTTNGGYFRDEVPAEHPWCILSTVLPLHVTYVIFCLVVTRSLAFAVAPAPERLSKQEIEARAELESKYDNQPAGDDGMDAALDILNDAFSPV